MIISDRVGSRKGILILFEGVKLQCNGMWDAESYGSHVRVLDSHPLAISFRNGYRTIRSRLHLSTSAPSFKLRTLAKYEIGKSVVK